MRIFLTTEAEATRWLLGRRIIAVVLGENPDRDERDGSIDLMLTLDGGVAVSIRIDENGCGQYRVNVPEAAS